WTIRIRETYRAGSYVIGIVVKNVVPLPSHLIDPIYVHWLQEMFFTDRERPGSPVDLPGAGKNNLHTGIVPSTDLQDRKLRLAVDLQINKGILHRVEVAGLSRQIK